MPKIYLDIKQGSTEWAMLRAGKPCSSEFSRIITPSGKPSKSSSDYCDCLLVETMLQRPLGTVEMPWMTRGKAFEEEAVRFYDLTRGVESTPVGFVTTDDGRIGCSPDRLIGDNALLEIKCPSEEIHARYLINALLGTGDGLEAEYRVQLCGQLFVTERDWVDIESYSPGLPEAVVRVGRDEKLIAEMRKLLYAFVELFDARLEKLRALGYIEERKEKQQPDFSAFEVTKEDEDRIVADLKQRGVLQETA